MPGRLPKVCVLSPGGSRTMALALEAERSVRTGWTILRDVNFGDRFLPTRELGMLYSMFGCLSGCLGLQKRSLDYINRDLQIQRELNDDFGIAYSANWSGIMEFATGEHAPAEVLLREAIERFERVVEVRELNMA